jgi:ATP synthase protein I
MTTLATPSQAFGGSSVWPGELLAKNFTSARFRLAMSEAPSGGPTREPPGERGANEGTSITQFAGVGLQFALSILVFLYVGQWLDKKLGTGPWLLLVGVFLGAGASFYSMYRKLMAAQARDEAARKARRDGAP